MGFFSGITRESLEKTPSGGGGFKVGDNPCRIKFAEEKKSKSGKDMLVVTFESSSDATIKMYISDSEFKISLLKNLMDSFGITTCDTSKWIGKRGVVVCKKKPYNGKTYLNVSYCKHLDDMTGDSKNDDISF